MQTIDYDLLSVQEARILAENSKEAQRELAQYSQEAIDKVIVKILADLRKNTDGLVKASLDESGAGSYEDKKKKMNLLITYLERKLSSMRCVGVVGRDDENKVLDIGVPMGVILAFCSEVNPVTTSIYKALISIKSGNSIIFNLEKNSEGSVKKTLDLIIKSSGEAGLPKGSISYLRRISTMGSTELIHHPNISLIMNTGVGSCLKEIFNSGKILIYGTFGSTPVFIERSADIKKAARDIVLGKSFDNGLVSGGEDSIIVDKLVLEEVIEAFEAQGAYFMKDHESAALKDILFDRDQNFDRRFMGRPARFLAEKAGFCIPEGAKLLISREKYASLENPYTKEKLCPVAAFFVEENWENACEKCIELLINEKQGHTLVLHSNDSEVIRQFSLKKPVGRILINTSGALGSMGITTNLFPSMTLGSGILGRGISSDNVSPMNLIYLRRVAYESRDIEEILEKKPEEGSDYLKTDLEETLKKILNRIFKP